MSYSFILLTGGAGFIGSFTAHALAKRGFVPLILDNLSTGDKRAIASFPFIEGSVHDNNILHAIFKKFPIQAVLHFAGSLDVGESFRNPLLYYRNNVQGALTLFETMLQYGITRCIFSSSASVYGVPSKIPLTEDHPQHPVSPYGQSKKMVEEILQSLPLSSIVFRYFNAAGGDSERIRPHFVAKSHNLIPLLIKGWYGDRTISIFGEDYPTPDGSCIRDYVHVEDLAEAHVLGLSTLLATPHICKKNYNLGIGHGFSVKEVIACFEKVSGVRFSIKCAPRRLGDPPILIASSSLAKKELLWEPKFCSLDKIIGDALYGTSF